MSSIARIAHGISDDLLTRTADVMLKERRKLVLVPRETPYSVIHLENMSSVTRAGALVLPASPSFYGRPRTLEDAIDTVLARVLDHIGLPNALQKRWAEDVALGEASEAPVEDS
jgi:4-hydroxy-3-polyprenylbenzoate decarboxylase